MNSAITTDIVVIPSGSFFMGCECGQENERPCHRVWVDGFGLGRFPVTNREYKTFVEENKALAPPFVSDPIFANAEQPVVGVSWDDAIAYCRWLSDRIGEEFRLPTEAEWERAARGGVDDARYPWGDDPPTAVCPLATSRLAAPPRVGAMPPNGFGLTDLSGVVHEWCLDWHADDFYAVSAERNPSGPPTGTRRVSRGGAWRHQDPWSPVAHRSSLPPSLRYSDYGLRLARNC